MPSLLHRQLTHSLETRPLRLLRLSTLSPPLNTLALSILLSLFLCSLSLYLSLLLLSSAGFYRIIVIAFGFSSDFSDSLSWSSIDLPLSFFRAFAFGGFRSFIQSLFLGDSQRRCLVFWFHACYCYENKIEDLVVYEVAKLMDMGVQEKECFL